MDKTFVFNISEGAAVAKFVAALMQEGIRYMVERDHNEFLITILGV